MHVFDGIDYIIHVSWFIFIDDACIYAFSLCLVCYVIWFGHMIYKYGCLYFLRIVVIFQNFLNFLRRILPVYPETDPPRPMRLSARRVAATLNHAAHFLLYQKYSSLDFRPLFIFSFLYPSIFLIQLSYLYI